MSGPPEKLKHLPTPRQDRTGYQGIPQDNNATCSKASPVYSLIGTWTPFDGDLTATHIIYLVVVLLGAMGSSVFSLPVVTNILGNTPVSCPSGNETCYVKRSSLAVHRTGFASSVFFLVLMLVLVKASFPGMRSGLHTGVWLPKLLSLGLLCCGAFVIPYNIMDTVWGYLAISAWFVFSFIQLAFVVDLSRSCSDFLSSNTSDGSSSDKFLSCFTVITCMLLAVAVALLYMCFGHSDNCQTNLLLITVNVAICIIVLVISCKARKTCQTNQTGSWLPCTGLLQAALVSGYVLYLTFTALIHGQTLCILDAFAFFGSISRLGSYIQSFCGTLLMCIILSYAFLRNPYPTNLRFNQISVSNEAEVDPVGHSLYSCFLVHFVFVSSSLYASVTFVPPHEVDLRSRQSMSWLFLGVKSTASVLVALVYLWMLLAPTIYPDDKTHDFLLLLRSLFKFIFESLYCLLFKTCPGLNQSTSTRFIYTFFFLCGTLASCLMYLPAVRRALGTNRFFCKRISKLGNCMSHDPGYLAVYRICLSMATFYLLFAVILYNVRSYTDPRALIHNGLWLVKFGLFFSLLICTFFIPLEFSTVWTYIGLAGTFFFIVIQMLLLVDFTRVWNNCFAKKTEVTGKKIWFRIIMFTTVALYVVSAAAVVCFYVFFVGEAGRCRTNKMFISMNFVLCGIATVVSIHPITTDTGLLQASTITFFTMYLTLSGLSYNPNENCNPVAFFVSEVDMRPNVSVQAVLDLLLTIVFLVYFSFRVVSLTESLRKLAVASIRLIAGLRYQQQTCEQADQTDNSGQNHSDLMNKSDLDDDEIADEVPYSYTFYHVVYFLGSLHVTMVLTNWYTPKNGSEFKLYMNWAAMCIKLTASSLCILLYIWSLVVPILMNKPQDNHQSSSA